MKSKRFIIVFCLVVFCFVLLSGCVVKEDVIVLDNRLILLKQRAAKLEKRYAEMQKQMQKNEAAAQRTTSQMQQEFTAYSQARKKEDQNLRTQAAELRQFLEEMREDVNRTNGRMEETAFVLKQGQETIGGQNEKILNDLSQVKSNVDSSEARIRRVEEYLNLETAFSKLGKPAGSVPTAAGKDVKIISATDLYSSAKKSFDQGDLESAREKFDLFLKKHPKSKQADNAQFWMGEIYYREKWYEKAILEYQKVIENYPRGNKISASLLKQGLAFHQLGDKENARLILRELIRKFPKSNEAKIARKKIKATTP